MDNELTEQKNYRLTIRACYLVQIAVAALLNVTPILFYFLMSLYNLKLADLGILVLITFIITIAVNLALSRFVDKIGFRLLMIIGTLLAGFGLIAFSVSPFIFKNNVFLGFIISTVIIALGSGVFQLLVSPIINSLPIKDKSGRLARLHSFYAWGAIFTVAFTTLTLELIKTSLGDKFWFLIPLILSVIPFVCLVLFIFAPLESPAKEAKQSMKKIILTPFFIMAGLGILASGASEIIISQWASTYIESVLQIDKILGDIVGVCLFALMLGLGRLLYSIYSRKINLSKIMVFSCLLALLCYFIIALSPFAVLSLIAFGLSGLAVSLLWPGILSLTSEKFPKAGTWLFAMLTALGSAGSAVGPYIIGQIGNNAPNLSGVQNLAFNLGIEPSELGLRIAVLSCAVFPILAFFAILYLHKKKNKKASLQEPLDLNRINAEH